MDELSSNKLESNEARCYRVEQHHPGEKRTKYSKNKQEAKIRGRRQLPSNCVSLPGRREFNENKQDENETYISWRANIALSTMVSKLARARLLWALLSLVQPVMFRYTTACHRSPALAFYAAIHFAMKRFAPCSAVLRHFPSS